MVTKLCEALFLLGLGACAHPANLPAQPTKMGISSTNPPTSTPTWQTQPPQPSLSQEIQRVRGKEPPKAPPPPRAVTIRAR